MADNTRKEPKDWVSGDAPYYGDSALNTPVPTDGFGPRLAGFRMRPV